MPAVTDTGFVEMRLKKVVGIGSAEGDFSCIVVLDGVSEDRHLQIQIGETEGFSLSCTLTGMEFARPMSPQFAAGLLHASGGRIRQVRIDRLMPVPAAGRPTAPPWKWKARRAWNWSTRGQATH